MTVALRERPVVEAHFLYSFIDRVSGLYPLYFRELDSNIDQTGHGRVRFTVPYLDDYLREHAAHDLLDEG